MSLSCIDEIYGPPLDIWMEVGDNPSILGLSVHKTFERPVMAKSCELGVKKCITLELETTHERMRGCMPRS